MIRITRLLVRELPIRDHRTHLPLVVKFEPGSRLIWIKVKRSRRWYWVSLEQLWLQAATNRAAEIRAERKAAREARRKT